jgi:N-methylhydantoinase A
MENAFHEKHETLYSYKEVGSPTELQSLRLVAFGKLLQPSPMRQAKAAKDLSQAIKMKRNVYFVEEGGFIGTPIYDEQSLSFGHEFEGPAVIESATTTIVVPPKTRLVVDEYGNYIITI